MKQLSILILLTLLTGCGTTTLTKYSYKDGVEIIVEKIKLKGYGRAKVDGDSYEIERKPFIEAEDFIPR